jgi:hypothetical protein
MDGSADRNKKNRPGGRLRNSSQKVSRQRQTGSIPESEQQRRVSRALLRFIIKQTVARGFVECQRSPLWIALRAILRVSASPKPPAAFGAQRRAARRVFTCVKAAVVVCPTRHTKS